MTNDNQHENKTATRTTTETVAVVRLPKIPVEQLRIWSARILTATGWILTLGLLGAGAASGVLGAAAWMLGGSDAALVLGLLGATILGVPGTVLLVRRLDEAARSLRSAVRPDSSAS
jgi:hypothetical protein